MKILGIESSCDETGLAIYEDGFGLLGNILYSQIALHQAYGGVVPELASRDHIRHLLPLLDELLKQCQINCSEIDAIAYTAGPGLAGSLLVGASIANALAFGLKKPIIPIHHLEGHILSPFLDDPTLTFPFLALLVSGGHTMLVQVNDIGNYNILGETLDDAAGEAFDKVAQLLSIPYPGGAKLSEIAKKGKNNAYKFPSPLLSNPKNFDFSFSGLKTAVAIQMQKLSKSEFISDQTRADIAQGFVNAIVTVLTKKSIAALKKTGLQRLVVGGGVSANHQLRLALQNSVKELGKEVFFPKQKFCTDNGAMIALAGSMRLKKWPDQATKNYDIQIFPRWPLTSQKI